MAKRDMKTGEAILLILLALAAGYYIGSKEEANWHEIEEVE